VTTLLWTGFTRLYFNAWQDAPRFWSVDRGFGTPELTAETILLKDATVVSVVDEQSNTQPRAWFEGAVSVFRDDNGSILICQTHSV
jgi:hypothetical protein